MSWVGVSPVGRLYCLHGTQDRGRSLAPWGLALATPFHMGGSCLKRAAALTPEPPCLLDRRPAPTWYWTKGLALLPQTLALQPGQGRWGQPAAGYREGPHAGQTGGSQEAWAGGVALWEGQGG